MNIAFFGSANFSLPSLKALMATRHKICCVATQPDKKKGRGLHLEQTAIKTKALELGLKVYQPPSINMTDAIDFLKKLNLDLFVVVAYGQILSKEILSIPKIFSLNAHASLLPRYRGAAPINWAIINGDNQTGVSIIKMTEAMDAGPIILEKNVEIAPADTSLTLEDKMASLAAELLAEVIKSIENKNYKLTVQDENNVNFAPKLKKENGAIDWNKSAADIHNLVRGVLPWPGAFTFYKDKLLKVYKAELIESPVTLSPSTPGEILQVSKEGIIVATGNGNLIIKELQIEGKRRMTVEEFISGYKIQKGEAFWQKKIA
jgi:methionyl-tRNA formyltransferase